MSFVEPRESNIFFFTRGGVVTVVDEGAEHGQLWVRLATQNKELFDVWKEKKVFLEI